MSVLKRAIERWFSSRSPLTDRSLLSNRNIYIIPSRAGWLLAGVLLVMLLTAINYQNSLIFGLCFWVGSVFAVVIWHTWRNLASIELSVSEEVSGFVGGTVQIPTDVMAKDARFHHSIELLWRESEAKVSFDLDSALKTERLPFSSLHRGWNRTPKLEIRTQYPLGILTAWSVVQLKHPVLGYPKPIFDVLPAQYAGEGDDEFDQDAQPQKLQPGSDFYSLMPYVEGDSLSKVDWKRYAKTEELVTKEFIMPSSDDRWLREDDFANLDTETRLSALAGWVIRWTEEQKTFGLVLSGQDIGPDNGVLHQNNCLRALALFEANQ
ncbi:DUF58 domain-containing protein [Litoribacillus peritrichatus]|uniref:DUF58 domain-containing protein n=1 Tax=Litoribacillus peritrichatus TaxID=718191 RepID=A0ABP7LYN4_9GAMM